MTQIIDTLDTDAHTVTMTLTIGELGILERALDLTAKYTPPGESGRQVRAMTVRIREAMSAAMLSTLPSWAYRPTLTPTGERLRRHTTQEER